MPMNQSLSIAASELNFAKLNFAKLNGLIPAVVQHADTLAVLMVGFMTPEALEQTRHTGRVVFHSRTRGRLWMKGESSGNELVVRSIHADCDRDSLLVMAIPLGPVCHTGAETCFGAAHDAAPMPVLLALERIIAERDRTRPEGSYTAALLKAGTERAAQKVGEEAVETAIAAVAGKRDQLANEAADLLYHLLVLLRLQNLELADITARLESRRG
jgi:phosphoribosyl-ATP pyrophosphohydrolase/phosphoribosyl-AMP cyclohydrolase